MEADDDEEDEIECLICSGLGTEGPDPAAQSVSSISTTNFEPVGANALNRQDHNGIETDSFGPLEEFCTTAPHKHVAHRECFLRGVSITSDWFVTKAVTQVGRIIQAAATEDLS